MQIHFVSVLVLLAIFGCSKVNDTEKPAITIVSPKLNDTIKGNNSEVQLEFTASDNGVLSSLFLTINDTNGKTYFTDSKSLSGQNYSYKNSFLILKNSKLKGLVLSVNIVDEAKNESISLRSFYLAP